ncbi:MAG TPA: hypothetical protein VFD82_12260 [Planctomycetota bacterium]|nr:hypothetical protein [Planctomycetota bacterium]
MSYPSRRTFLGCVGAGVLAGPARAARPVPTTIAGDLNALAELVRTTSRADLLPKAVELHRSGTHWRDLLGAAFLAGIRDVEPHPVGFQFHCVLVTSSAFQLAEGSPEPDRLAAALYNLDDFKLSQKVDERDGDWTLPPAPAVADLDARKATVALTEALTAWDRDAADRAATTLARCGSLDDAFEPLWWFGMRDFTNIGHNPIFVAQAHRTLQQIGWRFGEDVMRSLVRGLLDGSAGAADDAFVANLERCAALRLPADGKPSAKARDELLAGLRHVDADRAASGLAELLRGGLALESALDGLRLFAAEQIWRDPGVLAVHALTSLNALRYAAAHARTQRTQAMALLQAASWLVAYREFLSQRGGYDAEAPGIDAIEAAEGEPPAQAVFAAAAGGAKGAAGLALAAARKGTGGIEADVRSTCLRKVHEHHDFKFAAALLEEMGAAAADVAPRLFAASLGYLRKPSDADHALWKQMAAH